jgi:urea transporter
MVQFDNRKATTSGSVGHQGIEDGSKIVLNTDTTNNPKKSDSQNSISKSLSVSEANSSIVSSKKRFTDELKSHLAGIGQVIFSQKPIVGLTCLVGISLYSPILAVGAIGGSVLGNLFADLWRYDKNNINQGLYGFNSALVGIATLNFFSISPQSCALVLAGSALSTYIMEKMREVGLSPRTAPFVLSTWAIMAIGHVLNLSVANSANFGIFGSVTNSITDFGVLRGIGQIMFQNDPITGILFLAGILATSRKQGYFAIGGSIIGSAVALSFGVSQSVVTAGLWSYNSALSASAFINQTTKNISSTEVLKSGGAVLASLAFFALFNSAGLPALTAPFVLATWCIDYLSKKRL